MSGTEGTPARRRRLHRVAPVPRVPELDALLRDVDALRMTLETDLTLAASAVEAGEPGLAAGILGADREALANFEARALGRLETLAAESAAQPLATPRRRSWVPAQAATMVAAAALVGLLAGVVPQAISHRPEDTTPVAATDSLERIQELVLHGDPSEVRAASAELHEQLASVVAVAGTDPAAAQHALLLLSYEQTAIAGSADSSLLADVLRQSRALASAIRAALPPSVRNQVPPSPQLPRAETDTKSSPAPQRSAKASPEPTARTASPTQSPSPRPSSSSGSSSTNPYPLPSPPLAP